MVGKEDLINFKKMWIWLSAYPGYNREYYMENILKLDKMWNNSCPLSNVKRGTGCNGCQIICKSDKGTLCTDPATPLYQWLHTEKEQPENRAIYASSLAVLAMKFLRDRKDHWDVQDVRRSSPARIVSDTALNEESYVSNSRRHF